MRLTEIQEVKDLDPMVSLLLSFITNEPFELVCYERPGLYETKITVFDLSYQRVGTVEIWFSSSMRPVKMLAKRENNETLLWKRGE